MTAWLLWLAALASEPIVIVTDAATLDRMAIDVGPLVFGGPVSRSSRYRDLVETLRADLRDLYLEDSKWGVGMKFTHRGFDPDWLTMTNARWQLAAIVNRIDRRAFHPETCGELRLVFRLAYETPALSSRLPATLNVVYFIPDDGEGCRLRAASLHAPAGDATVIAARIRPLLVESRLKSIEVNVQTARWPSTIRPDLGGHADYALRVFHARGDRLVAGALENTPDVARLQKDPAARAQLLAWLREPSTLADIDAGIARMPESLAALRAVSVTPRGLARPQNRPWTKLFREEELAGLPLAGTATISSAAALLRRLDGLTCMGCHQSRSLAGFHVVGDEKDTSKTIDALAVGMSPHLEEDQARRAAYVAALVAGRAPDERRPPAERALGRGMFGDACGLADPGFASWRCAQGFSCIAVDEEQVGVCMPSSPVVGSACELGKLDFARDAIRSAKVTSCPADAVCEAVSVGFPGGMCAAGCGTSDPDATCGAIALLTPFNECLARGGLFSTCAQHARPAALRACGPGRPCRPDYLCAKTPSGAGACLPPYFVLQMRVDGHPLPSTRRAALRR